jgi:hypothetical protein
MAPPGLAPAAGRVRRVRLRAADQTLVRRGLVLLEDALHTAASGLGRRGRLTVVRRLTVGRIVPDRAPAHLGLRLESRLRQLADGARHWSDPAAAGAAAVYFEDEIAPYLGLAACLAAGDGAEAWFWPLAVPGWRRPAGRPSLPALLVEAARATRAGPLAAVEVVRALHGRGTVEALLATLDSTAGTALLAQLGWAGAAPPAPRQPLDAEPSAPRPAPAWAALLARWVGRWGRGDPRSIWLGAVALLAERPARLLDPSLRSRTERLVQALVGPPGSRRSAVNPTARPRAPLPARLLGEAALEPGAADADLPTAPTARPARAGPLQAGQLAEQPERSRPVSRPTPAGQPPTQRPSASGRTPASEPVVGRQAAADANRELRSEVGAPPRAGPVYPAPRPERTLQAAESIQSGPDAGRAPLLAPERPARPEPDPPPIDPAWPSEYAGLFFLLPALARLGIEEQLTTWPGLIELDLPVRVLAEVAGRLGAPDDDPIWRVLAGPGAAPPRRFAYSLPPRLSALASPGPWRIRPTAAPAGPRALADRSECLTLAVWQGRRPAGVRALLGGRRAQPGRPLPPAAELPLLLESWYTALRRWCRAGPGLSLAEVARRPGRLRATRTHLDLFFDPRQAEVRLRRAGLDLDPGWIAWFGRVVLFHYQESA